MEAVARVYGDRVDDLDIATKATLFDEQEREIKRAQLHGVLALGKLHGARLTDGPPLDQNDY